MKKQSGFSGIAILTIILAVSVVFLTGYSVSLNINGTKHDSSEEKDDNLNKEELITSTPEFVVDSFVKGYIASINELKTKDFLIKNTEVTDSFKELIVDDDSLVATSDNVLFIQDIPNEYKVGVAKIKDTNAYVDVSLIFSNDSAVVNFNLSLIGNSWKINSTSRDYSQGNDLTTSADIRDNMRKNDSAHLSENLNNYAAANKGNFPSDSDLTNGLFIRNYMEAGNGSWISPSETKYLISLSGAPSIDNFIFTRGKDCNNASSSSKASVEILLESGEVYCQSIN